MELITFRLPINDGDALEYKLNDQNDIYTLTNVAKHLNGIYEFKEPIEGTGKDKFIIEYSGNKDLIIDDLTSKVAHYVLLKEKEGSRYLVAVDLFKQMFISIN